jgi:hypothetical protein
VMILMNSRRCCAPSHFKKKKKNFFFFFLNFNFNFFFCCDQREKTPSMMVKLLKIFAVLTLLVMVMAISAATATDGVATGVRKVEVKELKMEIETEGKTERSAAAVFSPSKTVPATTTPSTFYEGDTLRFSFSLSFPDDQQPISPQQVFLSFSHPDLAHDLVFVAPTQSPPHYSLVVVSSLHLLCFYYLNLFIYLLIYYYHHNFSTCSKLSGAFKGFPGEYSATLIIGDSHLQPLLWKFGSLKLEAAAFQKEPGMYNKYPEIQHIFRTPEKQPPFTISLIFSAFVFGILALLPIAVKKKKKIIFSFLQFQFQFLSFFLFFLFFLLL